eukprot:scaffold2644_cov76-Alexandrium_tamarense.AAC.1
MRAILIDWLVEVHLKFNEGDEAEVATVGTTALLIASKFEKIHPPELSDLVYICDRGYTEDE